MDGVISSPKIPNRRIKDNFSSRFSGELNRKGKEEYPLLSTALAAYSIWKTRPSGENVVTERS